MAKHFCNKEKELAGKYICPIDGQIQDFARLSSSEERGYPYLDSTKGYKDCVADDGTREKWQDLYSYANAVGVDPYDLLPVQEKETKIEKTSNGESYKCPPNNQGCYIEE